MAAKKKAAKKVKAARVDSSFAAFLADPLVATSLIVFALIALLLSILEFSKAISL